MDVKKAIKALKEWSELTEAQEEIEGVFKINILTRFT